MKFYTLLGSLLALVGAIECQASNSASPSQATAESAQTIKWMTDFEAAKALAKSQNKPLFLYFTGSDWCPWCMKMSTNITSTADFQNAAGDKFIFVMVDDPRKSKLDSKTEMQNVKLRDEYGVHGYPSVVLVDPSGKRINSSSLGYKDMRQDPRYKDLSMGAAYAKMLSDVISAYNTK
jgi:thioredoxin-related protein